MHELELPRRYRTIFVCGAFGLGSTRERDYKALTAFHEYLEPDGTFVFDIEVPYADSRHWQYWLKDGRRSLPDAVRSPGPRRRGSDGAEYSLRSQILGVDALEQRVTYSMHEIGRASCRERV